MPRCSHTSVPLPNIISRKTWYVGLAWMPFFMLWMSKKTVISFKRNDMETLPALLAFGDRCIDVTKVQCCGFLFDLAWTSYWTNKRVASHLRCHDACIRRYFNGIGNHKKYPLYFVWLSLGYTIADRLTVIPHFLSRNCLQAYYGSNLPCFVEI